MGHEKDHGVLSNVVEDRNAWRTDGEQESGDATKREGDIEHHNIVVAFPHVVGHGVFATIQAIQ